MENRCGIIGVREDEDAIELELGLSIGGSFGKAEKLKPIKKNTNHNLAEDLGEIMVFDHQTKREIQALRRQEAKKKREEKQHKRGAMVSTSVHQNGELKSKDNDVDATEERECKKNKVQYFSGNLNLKLGAEQNNPLVCPVIPVPLPCPLPYPQVQLVPFANGFAYSCVNAMPCWIGAAANEKSVVQVQPVAGTGGFRPFQAGQDSCLNQGDGNVSERNIRRDDKNRKTLSNGSPMCSSSVVSDLQSSSNQGGCSSETVTNTSYCQLEQPRINCSVASNLKGQSEQSSTSHHMDSAQSIEKSAKGIEKSASMKVIDQSTLSNPMEEGSKPETQPNLNSNPALTNETPTTILTKTIMGKPPKPQTPTHDDSFSPRNMPCVSTTGNGPNGKTINGFLYRYTKSEVSIVCVCHGSSFTPAEFVQHAGGTDVSHPLRHITVIPSSF